MTNTPPVSPEQWQLAFEAEKLLFEDLRLAQIAARNWGTNNLTDAVDLLHKFRFAVVAKQSDGVAVVDLLHAGGASLEVEGESITTMISGILAITTVQTADPEEAA